MDAKFAPAGQRETGGGLNVRMEAEINQRARQVRIKLAPAAENRTVYLSEIELLGTVAGKHAPINVVATGDLGGDGAPEVVVGTATGRIMAVAADGTMRWNYDTEGRSSVDAIACSDIGRRRPRRGPLRRHQSAIGRFWGGDGRLRWQTQPPRYRGLNSDVETVFAADIRGDGRPAVVCGCLSWQYFAYDAKGEKLWQSVIYAPLRQRWLCGRPRRRPEGRDHRWQRLLPAQRAGARRETSLGRCHDRPGDHGRGCRQYQRRFQARGCSAAIDGGDVICFDAAGKQLWHTNLGDKITRIVLSDLDGDGVQEILCASDSAQVVALKGDGKVLWRYFLPGGCADMAVRGQGPNLLIAAAAGVSGLVVLDSAGHMRWQNSTSGNAQHLAIVGSQVVVSTGEGAIESFRLPAK